MIQGSATLDTACLSAWLPRKRMDPLEWIPQNIYFSAKESAFAGYWSRAMFPYSDGPLKALADPTIRMVVMSWATRLGKTSILTAFVCWTVENDPGPVQITCPDQDSAHEHYKTKLMPMFEACEAMRSRLLPRHERTLGLVDLGDVWVYYGWMGAPRTLSARGIRYQFITEANLGGYAKDQEGSHIEMAFDRVKDFPNHKIIIEGKPTIKGECRVTEYFEQSDQRYYYVPCPNCATFQRLVFGDRESVGGIKWGFDGPTNCAEVWSSTPVLARESAYYQCEHCRGRITDADKIVMLQRGEWRASKPTGRIAGFQISSLYSPVITFGEVAENFLRKKRSGVMALQNFVNSWLSEPFDLRGRRATTDEILSHRVQEWAQGFVPFQESALVCSVDVQRDRLYYVLRAWTAGGTSHLVRYGMLMQDGGRAGTDFQKLDIVLLEAYPGAEHTEHRVQLVLIDSGYEARQTEVYDYCQVRQPWCIPCKGRRRPGMGDLSHMLQISQLPERGIPLWRVSPYQANNELFDRVLKIKQGDPGYWSLHAETGTDYAAHFTAVARTQDRNKTTGETKIIWEQVRDDDHWLDCEKLQLAARDHYGLSVMRVVEEKERKPDSPQPKPTAAYEIPRRRDGRGWLER